MPRNDTGSLANYEKQPDSELIYHDTGLIEGVLIVAADISQRAALLNMVGGTHPDEEGVALYGLRIRNRTLELLLGTFDCIGIDSAYGDTTEKRFSVVPAQELVPIEAHPDFHAGEEAGYPFAGPESGLKSITGDPLTDTDLYAQGKNGARFTISKKKVTSFLGFLGADAPDDLRAVRSYQRNNPVLRATWYTFTDPTFPCNSVIVSHPSGAPNARGVTNWLRAAPIGDPVGSKSERVLWKMTQEYVGSETGWNTDMYDSEEE